jgi:DnaJ-class molecular chaperone
MAPAYVDHFKALNLLYTATTEQIKKATKGLMFKHHPDKHNSSAAIAPET